MPHSPRLILPSIPLHLIHRGNNRQACFAADKDYGFDRLEQAAQALGKSGYGGYLAGLLRDKVL